jgi:serine/threonine protein kinase
MTQDPTLAPHDPLGWVGSLLDGKYRIDGVVGEGGFGIVYAGHHLGFDEPIAIKFLKLDASIEGAKRERFLKQFTAEGKLLYRLSHASAAIVRAIDVGAAVSPKGKWAPYLVLEWVRGRTLEKEIAERVASGLGGRSLAEAIALLTPAARGLNTAHDEGVAHRDVKPANFIVTEVRGKPTIKVLDFGVAKVVGSARDHFGVTTKSPSLHAFTPTHGAPEQFESHYGATGPWTDVFALALVLVEVVSTKRALFGSNAAERYMAATDASLRPTLRAHGVACSNAVERVLQRALAVEPRNRYQRAGEFWDALMAASAGEPSTVQVAGTSKDQPHDTAPGTQPDTTEIPEIPITVPQAPSHAAIGPVSHTVDDPNHDGSERVVPRGAPKGRQGRGLIGLVLAMGVGAAATYALVRSMNREDQRQQPAPSTPSAPAITAAASLAAPSAMPVDAAAVAVVESAVPRPPAAITPSHQKKPQSPPDPRCSTFATGQRACGQWSQFGSTWCGGCPAHETCVDQVCKRN